MKDNLEPLTTWERLVLGVALFHYFKNGAEDSEFLDANDLVEKFSNGWNLASLTPEFTATYSNIVKVAKDCVEFVEEGTK